MVMSYSQYFSNAYSKHTLSASMKPQTIPLPVTFCGGLPIGAHDSTAPPVLDEPGDPPVARGGGKSDWDEPSRYLEVFDLGPGALQFKFARKQPTLGSFQQTKAPLSSG